MVASWAACGEERLGALFEGVSYCREVVFDSECWVRGMRGLCY